VCVCVYVCVCMCVRVCARASMRLCFCLVKKGRAHASGGAETAKKGVCKAWGRKTREKGVCRAWEEGVCKAWEEGKGGHARKEGLGMNAHVV
jgi:hypothetical protein